MSIELDHEVDAEMAEMEQVMSEPRTMPRWCKVMLGVVLTLGALWLAGIWMLTVGLSLVIDLLI